VPAVVGFANEYKLRCHFRDHGKKEFGASTKEEYSAMAKLFLEKNLSDNPNIVECVTKDGDIARFDRQTQEYAIVTPNGIIKTYFKPIPHHLAPPGTPLDMTHPHPNNITYFRSNCRT
jgi:pyocin large subunit-like protein